MGNGSPKVRFLVTDAHCTAVRTNEQTPDDAILEL